MYLLILCILLYSSKSIGKNGIIDYINKMKKLGEIPRDSRLLTPAGIRGMVLKAKLIMWLNSESNRELADYLYVSHSSVIHYMNGTRTPSKAVGLLLHRWLYERRPVWTQLGSLVGDMNTFAQAFIRPGEYLEIFQGNRWLIKKRMVIKKRKLRKVKDG